MLEAYLLEELVIFNQVGTLAETANRLHLTQPTITRGLQKLETEFGVQLFDRQPNRLSLTSTGQLAAEEAAKLLAANQNLLETVQNFDQNQYQIRIGSTVPGPLILCQKLDLKTTIKVTVNQNLIELSRVVDQLHQRKQSLIFTNEEIMTENIESRYIGTESLFVYLNRFMYEANQPTISFAELANQSFLVLHDIGPWRTIIQREIPSAHFMYQAEKTAMQELTKYADFPAFTTNITQDDNSKADDGNRVNIPIRDDSAKMPIYAAYLKASKSQVEPLIQQVIHEWPN